MIYAKFIDKNKIEYLPKNAVLGGESFSIARLLPAEKLAKFGFYPVEYQKEPEYNAESEYLHINYEFDGEKITVSYEVRELFI